MLLAPQPALSGTLYSYSAGPKGAHQTIAVMRELVRQYRVDPYMRQAATTAVYHTPEKHDLHEVNTLFELVQRNVRYVRDICDVETIATPDKVLQSLVGDCDDQSLLLATLLESIGYHTRFVIAGYNIPGQFEHVYLQVFLPQFGEWINADPTEHEPLGYAPPNPITYFEERV